MLDNRWGWIGAALGCGLALAIALGLARLGVQLHPLLGVFVGWAFTMGGMIGGALFNEYLEDRRPWLNEYLEDRRPWL